MRRGRRQLVFRPPSVGDCGFGGVRLPRKRRSSFWISSSSFRQLGKFGAGPGAAWVSNARGSLPLRELRGRRHRAGRAIRSKSVLANAPRRNASVSLACPGSGSIWPLEIAMSRQHTGPVSGVRARGRSRRGRSTFAGSWRRSSALARKVGSLSSSGSSCGCTCCQRFSSCHRISANIAAKGGMPNRFNRATARCVITLRSRVRSRRETAIASVSLQSGGCRRGYRIPVLRFRLALRGAFHCAELGVELEVYHRPAHRPTGRSATSRQAETRCPRVTPVPRKCPGASATGSTGCPQSSSIQPPGQVCLTRAILCKGDQLAVQLMKQS